MHLAYSSKYEDISKKLEDELSTFLSSFNLLEALRAICRLASASRYGFCAVNVVHQLILHSSDDNTKLMSDYEGYKALEMDFNIQECKLIISSIHETFLKLENQQHDNNEIIKYDRTR